ncbi:MAG: sterol desaturase family protein [Saprospiraceae bacterium]|nr:sterol desaturase family protein [Saprospiraceae bacterium]
MLNAIALFIPIFLLLVGIEWYISQKKEDQVYATGNTVMNMTIGAIDQISSLFYFVALFVVLEYVYTHFRILEIDNNWMQWVLAFFAVDFLSYWYHRLSHTMNIFWAGHVTHHSSEYFNLTNGFRTSFFQGINRIIFWAVLPVFGFSPIVLIVILKISGIHDFFLHTQYISKLGFLEKIFVTPSLHRVHHGKNDIYIDKNFGSVLLIWDYLFGTLQRETEEVQYGIKGHYVDNSPVVAIGHHYFYLWKTISKTKQWYNKFKLLVMPPDWVPDEVQSTEGTPVQGSVSITTLQRSYAYFQTTICVIGVILLLVFKNMLSIWELLLFSGILVSSLSISTLIFNKNIRPGFINWESFRLICSIFLVSLMMTQYSGNYLLVVLLYLFLSLFLNIGNKENSLKWTNNYFKSIARVIRLRPK